MKDTAQATVLDNLRAALNRLEPSALLDGKELAIEHDKASLNVIGTDIIAGVAIEFLDGYTVGELLEATRVGKPSFMAIIEALNRMTATSSRPARREVLDSALQSLDDFGKILIGIHYSNLPKIMVLSRPEIKSILCATADAVRYAEQEVGECPEWKSEHLVFLKERLADHEKLNHDFGKRFFKSEGKDYCEVEI